LNGWHLAVLVNFLFSKTGLQRYQEEESFTKGREKEILGEKGRKWGVLEGFSPQRHRGHGGAQR
jgi:hypothetical protein